MFFITVDKIIGSSSSIVLYYGMKHDQKQRVTERQTKRQREREERDTERGTDRQTESTILQIY